MQLRTHLAFGLLFGVLLFYLSNFEGAFVLLTGIASLLPDIDWAMQFKWGLGYRHRTFMHNIWAMSAVVGAAYYLGSDLITLIAIAVGYAGHLLADSLTVTGVSWLYPYEGEMRLRGPINMSNGGRGYWKG
jgi:inner membrane protein